LRTVLERYFIGKVSSDPSKHDFGTLERCIEKQKNAQKEQDIPKYLEANGEFHFGLAEMCNNDRMKDTYENLVDLIRLIALQGMEGPKKIGLLIEQHESLLQAVRSGESSMANALLTIHLKESEQTALSWIKNRLKTEQIELVGP
jgi:DNA-binding GntR family transcriptional regulator